MNCMVCKTPFYQGDIETIRHVKTLSICQECEVNTVELHVVYDGADDLLDHLKEEVTIKAICSDCNALEIELLSIKFGAPIKGDIQCNNCELEDELYIYLEMV